MGKEESKKKLLCEDEHFIIDALRCLGAKGNDAVGPLRLLNQED